jgi:nicotinamide mononucleotide transporter
LYADTFEQIYYLGVSIYGWWYWIRDKNKDKKDKVGVYFSPKKSILKWATATLIVSIILSYVDSKLNVLVPEIFTTPASFPFLDTLTTIMSLTAMFLMARKRIESWVYWIIVDVIGIWLYYVKDVRFISLLYVILFVMALNGLKSWTNTRRTTAQVSK